VEVEDAEVVIMEVVMFDTRIVAIAEVDMAAEVVMVEAVEVADTVVVVAVAAAVATEVEEEVIGVMVLGNHSSLFTLWLFSLRVSFNNMCGIFASRLCMIEIHDYKCCILDIAFVV
jgi:hypothetical protein